MRSLLTPLQQRLAEEFFAREGRFVLTGGAALSGYHLGHRTTHDLDLFATAPLLEEGGRALRAACEALGASLQEVVHAPDFRRFVARSGDASVLVDLVHDRAPKGRRPGVKVGSVVVDPPEEILANKLCTLLSRSEPRDLVDVLALDRAGFRVEDAVPLAALKDGGLTPGQLSWVLSQVAIGDDADVPGGCSPQDLRDFLDDLQHRLARMAWPQP